MPEHIHLLISKPEIADPSVVMSVIKQGTARQFLAGSRTQSERLSNGGHFWQKRFYDFNVYSERKRIEKLKYMHRNPVKRGLVASPEEWQWSSFRFYYLDEPRPLVVTKFVNPPVERREGWGTLLNYNLRTGGPPAINQEYPRRKC
jgi:putative transposase